MRRADVDAGSTLRVRQLATGEVGPEAIERVTSFDWTEDGKTLLYTVEHPQTKRSYQLFRHALGAAQALQLVLAQVL